MYSHLLYIQNYYIYVSNILVNATDLISLSPIPTTFRYLNPSFPKYASLIA